MFKARLKFIQAILNNFVASSPSSAYDYFTFYS